MDKFFGYYEPLCYTCYDALTTSKIMINKGHYDETELLYFLSKGDSTAFARLYDSYKLLVYRNALKMLKEEEFAQEILQEVFLKIWNNRTSIDVDRPFKPYLFQIMRNSIYDYFRKIARDKKLLEVLAQNIYIHNQQKNTIEDHLYYKETAKDIEAAIQALPPKCREVFILCKIEGRSYDEVANLLQISQATVNNHIVKGTRIVKEILKNVDLHTALILLILYK